MYIVLKFIHIHLHICIYSNSCRNLLYINCMIWANMHICICTHVYICIYMCKTILIYLHIYTYTYVSTNIHVCINTCTHVHLCIMYMSIYTYIYVHVFKHIQESSTRWWRGSEQWKKYTCIHVHLHVFS